MTTLEAYLKCSDYEPDAEFVDGQIEERPMGELDHAAWQGAIYSWFRKHGKEWNVRAFPELRVQVAPSQYRVPDVTVIDRNQPSEQVITRPPIAVFEVMSSGDTIVKVMKRLHDYQGMGIQQIWLVFPETGKWLRFMNGQLVTETEFRCGSIHFEISEIAGELDV